MSCTNCGGRRVYSPQKGRELCAKCFSRLIEKRIRKNVRLKKAFANNDKILVIGDLAKYFITSILGERPVKVFYRASVNKEFVKKNKINKIVRTWTLDDVANEFLSEVLLGEKIKKRKYIDILSCITDSEAELFSKLHKIKFIVNKKDKDIVKLLKTLSDKHTHAKFSLLQNIEKLNRLT